LVGVHFFLAAALAWLIRGNVIAAMFGTVIGNPWTLPVIWLSTYEIGHLIIGRGGIEGANLNFTQMFQGLLQSMIEADGHLFLEQVWPILMPMLVGSIPCATLTWIFVYTVCFRLTATYQSRRKAKRLVKARKIRCENNDMGLVP